MTKNESAPKVGDVLSPKVTSLLTGKHPVQETKQESTPAVPQEEVELEDVKINLTITKNIFDQVLGKANINLADAIALEIARLNGYVSRKKSEYQEKTKKLQEIKRQIWLFQTGKNSPDGLPAPEIAKAIAKQYGLVIETVITEVENSLKETSKTNSKTKTPDETKTVSWQVTLPDGHMETFDDRIKAVKRLYEAIHGSTLNFKASEFLKEFGIPQTGGHSFKANGQQYQLFKITA